MLKVVCDRCGKEAKASAIDSDYVCDDYSIHHYDEYSLHVDTELSVDWCNECYQEFIRSREKNVKDFLSSKVNTND